MLQSQSKTIINNLKHMKNFSICSTRYLGSNVKNTSNFQSRYAASTIINFVCAAQNVKTIIKIIPRGNNYNFVKNLHSSSNVRAPKQRRTQRSEEIQNYIFLSLIAVGVLTVVVLYQLTNEDYDRVNIEKSDTKN